MEYRIRWVIGTVCNGKLDYKSRMCIAERRTKFLGIPFWVSVANSKWRLNEAEALFDIENDKELRKPLPKPRIIT